MRKKIFIALSTFAKHGQEPLEILGQSGFDYFVNPSGRRLVEDELIQMGRDCHGVVAGVEPYKDRVLDNMPYLECISRCGVGIDNIAVGKAKEKGVTILNTPDVVVQPVAELTVAMAFDLLRKLTAHTMLLKSRRWERKTGYLLKGKKVGILGLGRIGKRVAEIMVKLNVEVYGTEISPDKTWLQKEGVHLVSCNELLKISDLLSIHLSCDTKNPFQLGEKEMQMMKKGAMVINVSRGQFIDEPALYTALKSGDLGGAALDVYEDEPYTGPLCELENVILTPHVATLTQESRLQMELEATRNLIDFLKSNG